MFRNGLLWGQTGPLMDAHEEGDGAGGGAGEGQDAGNGGGNSGGDGDGGDGGAKTAEVPLTLGALEGLLSKLVPNLVKGVVTEQVNGLDKKWDNRFKKLTVEAPKTGAEGAGAEGAAKTKVDPFKEDREQELEQRLAQIEQERKAEQEQSRNRERDSEIRSALSEFPWKSAEDRTMAFDYYQGKATRDEDGNLVIGATPLNNFIKQHAAKQFKAFFIPRDVGGSGNAGAGGRNGKEVTLDAITPGMSADLDAKVRNTLTDLLAQARQG